MADTAPQSVSLRDDLSAIYDKQENETPEVEETLVEAEPKSRVRDESGKFVKATGNDSQEEETEPVSEEEPESKLEPEKVQEPSIEAPQHWSAEDKAAFTKIPKDAQEFVLRRYKAMEADYTRKTQEVADTKRFKDNFDQLLNPYRNHFAMQGLDDVGAVRNMLGWYNSLQQNPAQTLQVLAQQYGIDFNQKQDENVDPNFKALRDEIQFLKSQIAQTHQAQQQQVSSNLFEQVNSFRDEKDSTGNLKHPHFETVRKDMAVFVETGRAKNMEDAYQLAVRLHPDIHDKSLEQSILEKQKAAQQQGKQKDIDDAAKKAAQAKKAATGIRSGSASVEKQGPQTLRGQLSQLYDKQAAS
jgi:hypothetical protein